MTLIDTLLADLAWFLLIGYIFTLLEFMIGNRSIKRLQEIPMYPANQTAPRVSVIIPARNEERNIEEALTSVLNLDYPNLEILLLNDRSQDKTGEILERMSQQYPQLKVFHIEHLPDGWLGKNHALYYGAKQATGDILLFTDADIVMEPSTLSRAVHALAIYKLDHLASLPAIRTDNFALKVFVSAFTIYFSLFTHPWLARFPKLPHHIGVGAFNMLRRNVYEQIGTFQAIALRPDDDIKLGKLVKKYGFKQDVFAGPPLIQVEWYTSLGELIQGLMKNAFSGLEYNLPLMVLGTLAQFLFGVWPLIAVFITHGTTQMLYLAILILMQLLCLDHALYYGMTLWCGPLFPLSTLLFMYILVRATILTYLQNGIVWRGTHYSLAQLKANRV